MKNIRAILTLVCILLLSIVVGGLYAGSRRILEGATPNYALTNDMCTPTQANSKWTGFHGSKYACENGSAHYLLKNGTMPTTAADIHNVQKKSYAQGTSHITCSRANSSSITIKKVPFVKGVMFNRADRGDWDQINYGCHTDGKAYHLKTDGSWSSDENGNKVPVKNVIVKCDGGLVTC